MSGKIRAQEILRHCPANPVGAEIGVAAGETSAELLKQSPGLFLYMVDSWADPKEQRAHYRDSGDYHAMLSLTEQDQLHTSARAAVAPYNRRFEIMRMDSFTAAARLSGQVLFDFVFIDADHTYEGCRGDIEAWRGLVKPGGVLCGHDYDLPGHPNLNVKKAVDEAVSRYGWELELGSNYTWFVEL
jgi:hypothetical protein